LIAQYRWKDVESLMFSVIYIDYYNYYANLRLCKALEEQKKYKQELQIAEKMTYIYPTSVPFLLYLAKSYYYLGNKEKAKYLFEQILILDPENLVAKSFIQKLINQSKSPPKGGNKEN
jgi:tetratricopeptide (TPR) repeat protein